MTTISTINADHVAVRSEPKFASTTSFYSYPAALIMHFNESTNRGERVPMCHARSVDGIGWSRGHYTSDIAHVTCKRCLKSIATQARR